jgi:hypothetical protein
MMLPSIDTCHSGPAAAATRLGLKIACHASQVGRIEVQPPPSPVVTLRSKPHHGSWHVLTSWNPTG